jgi:hypothetical protein
MSEGNRLSDMDFDEISLVTRPANQLSKVVLYKGDTMPEQEEVLEDLEHSVTKGGGMKKPHSMKMEDDDDEEDDEDEMIKSEREEMLSYIDTLESANDDLMSKLDEVSPQEELLKSADPELVAIVKAAEDRAATAEAIAKAERDYRVEREFISKAEGYSNLPVNAQEFGLVLKSAAENLDEKDFEYLAKTFAAADEMIETGATFNEIGQSTSFDAESGMGRIEQMAKNMQAEDPTLSREAAISKAVMEDPTLYDSYLKESN